MRVAKIFVSGVIGMAISPAMAQVDSAPVPSGMSPAEVDASEIVVTGARLREESVQDTPLAVSSLNGKSIDALKAANIAGLSGVVPNLVIIANASTPGNPIISIRGFSASTSDISVEPAIPVYIDGIYQSIIAGSLKDMFDVERVEVLRGPQGTLLGKNAEGGAVLITRARPTGEFGGRARLEYGSFNLVQGQVSLNVPIVPDILAGKVYGSYRRQDNFIHNLDPANPDAGGVHQGTVRGAVLLTPGDRFKLYLTADYNWDRSSPYGGPSMAPAGYTVCTMFQLCNADANRSNTTRAQFSRDNNVDDINIVSDAELELGGIKLTSLTGYKKLDLRSSFDLDQTRFNIIETDLYTVDLKQFSQEARISSVENGGADLDGRLAWVLGGFYQHSNGYSTQTVRALGAPRSNSQKVIRKNYAVFAHVDFDLLTNLTVSAGVRRSKDKTTHDYALPLAGPNPPPLDRTQSAKFSNTSFEGSAQYKLDADKMVYFRYAEGYRGGGFIGFPGTAATAVGYDPETSISYEAGLKTQWLDRRVQFNVTLFDVKYSDLQRTAIVPGPVGYLSVTANVAEATTKGIEIETVFKPFDGFSLRANFGYLDAKYNKFISFDAATGLPIDRSNTPFPFAPKYNLSLTPRYEVELSGAPLGFDRLELQSQVNYRSATNTAATLNPAGKISGFTTYDAQVTLGGQASGLSLNAYVKNISNKRYITYFTDVPPLAAYVFRDPGRIFGGSVTLSF